MNFKLTHRVHLAIAGIVCVAILGFVVLYPRLHQRRGRWWVSRNFNITLISQVVPSAGKTVTAIKDGVVMDRYVCREEDALVAWFYDPGGREVDSEDGFGMRPDGLTGPVLDDRGNRLIVLSRRMGKITRMRILRGYAHRPKEAQLQLVDGIYTLRRVSQSKKIRLTAFAEPKRYFPFPSPKDVRRNESYAKVIRHNGLTRVMPTREVPGEQTEVDITQSPFSPLGRRSGFRLPFLREVDSVKVRYRRYRLDESTQWLTYRNAELRKIDRKVVLTFPTNQTVGKLLDVNMTVRRSLPDSTLVARSRNTFTADLFIQFDQKSTEDMAANPIISIAAISPTVAELGVAKLQIRIGRATSGADFVANSTHPPRLGLIPEFRVAIKVKRPILVEERELVLPVHDQGEEASPLFALNQPQQSGIESETRLYLLPSQGTARFR